MKRILTWLLGIAIVLAITYMVGPKLAVQDLGGDYPSVPGDLVNLADYVSAKEDTVVGLKADNEATIVWADPEKKEKTQYSILYIHGFGASHMEGDPVHREIAKAFGANLYLTRLPEHGIEREDAFIHLTPQKLVEGAREAFSIAAKLGEEVIVIGTSMGGALSLVVASEQPDIKALLLYSPCIREYGDQLEPLFQPWMKNLMEATMTDNGVQIVDREGDKAKYWANRYHINAYTSLAVLIRSTMNQARFAAIRQPTFMAYYYKDEDNQDKVVSVPAMLDMFDQLGTPEKMKVKEAFDEAADHVIASRITSKDWQGVLDASISFLEDVVKIPRIRENEPAETEF